MWISNTLGFKLILLNDNDYMIIIKKAKQFCYYNCVKIKQISREEIEERVEIVRTNGRTTCV